MDPEKPDNNLESFIKQHKKMLEGKNTSTSVLNPEELFSSVNGNFNEFHEDDLQDVLGFVHGCIKVWVHREDYLKDDIEVLLINLLQEHNRDEHDKKVAIQIVYQFLNSFKFFGCQIPTTSEKCKLLRELGAMLLLIESRILASYYLACMEKYMEISPNSCDNLIMLWSDLKEKINSNMQIGIIKDVEIDVFLQLFDCFKLLQPDLHNDPIVGNAIQYLLLSDERKYRKCGYFLCKKLYGCLIENISFVTKMWMSENHQQQIERTWTTYITILENLEEGQSHLILPSLENIKFVKKDMHISWLKILYMRLLTHNNNLVLRWALEFFLSTFTCQDLCKDTLTFLLQATNCNAIFNYEGYFLKKSYIESFLQGDIAIFLTLFSEIQNWKSIPLYIWLSNIYEIHSKKNFTFGEILKLSACVRKTQNKTIRKKLICLCNRIFKDGIKKMSIHEYITYIERLYNTDDDYDDYLLLFSKKSSIIQSEKTNIFNQRFYEFFIKSNFKQSKLIEFLKDIPFEKQGWLKYAPFENKFDEEEMKIICNSYNLDLNNIEKRSLKEVINHFKIKLIMPPHDKNEELASVRAAIGFCIHHKIRLDQEEVEYISNYNSNNGIGNSAVHTLLLNCEDQNIKLGFIDKLLESKSFSVVNDVISCIGNSYDEDTIIKYVSIYIKQTARSYAYSEYIKVWWLLDMIAEVTNEIMTTVPSQGDKRIEEAFMSKEFDYWTPLQKLYYVFLDEVQNDENEMEIIKDLLELHLSKKKARYFENTFDHRIKLRIAFCILCVFKSLKVNCTNANISIIWDILLNENNQLNVTYIYEFILGIYGNNDIVLDKLREAQNMTSRQQVSVITVVYTYYATHDTSENTRQEVVKILLSFSMGANFQTRLAAQLSLYKLLKGKFASAYNCRSIIYSIEVATAGKIEEYLSDIRFNFADLKTCILEAILYITNAPYDEAPSYTIDDCELKKKIESCREWYLRKSQPTISPETKTTDEVSDDMQRKMNPNIDLIMKPQNLIVYPTEEKSAKMYVVASLIDKLPNLGGIARTCEVLGITNLVMDSKRHTENKEFKSLSMTAEKNLNIHEVKSKDLKGFLISKKLEGFDIVGAEQTCKSKGFNNFQFPEKCVLLLGHEKDGIPAPLLSLLDHAVEIPQFGQVRSLNVHVTGALFMWEYCKQHLIKQ